MNERRRILMLIAVMLATAVGGVLISIYVLYDAGFDEEKDRLREIAQSRARIIESIADFAMTDRSCLNATRPNAAFQATLLQIQRAHENFQGFGQTGEFTLAQRKMDQIVFLLSHRHHGESHLTQVPLSSTLAEPMRRALNRSSGTLVGLDYRGELVLAAHEPVGVYNLGIVAKIDLAEIQQPFFMAGLISILILMVFIALGTLAFVRIGHPIIDKLERETTGHERAKRGLADSEARLQLMVSEIRDYAIFMLDPQGYVSSWNAGAQAIKGFTADEIIGRHFSTFYTQSDIENDKPRKELDIVLRDGRYEEEGPRVRKDGRLFEASVVITALRNADGELVGFAKITRDISDRKRAEDAIKQSLAEKEVLLREVHHRVKNNLQIVSSLLNLQRSSIPDSDARTALEESRDRINTMAMVHEKLYGSASLQKLNFRDYVQAFAGNLLHASRTTETSQIKLQIDGANIELDVERAIPTGMIINEFMANSLKHAFPRGRQGHIRVSLRQHADAYVLQFEDDGVGFPDEVVFDQTTSLGLRLVNMFAKQLEGTIEHHREQGSKFMLAFPAGGN